MQYYDDLSSTAINTPTPITCDKLNDIDVNGRYLIVLKDDTEQEEAERLIQIINEYHQSCELNLLGRSTTTSKLTYYPVVNQLIGSLSDKALLLVCM